MADDNRRHVVPGKKGGWDIRKPGSTRSSGNAPTQSGATKRVKEIVGKAGGGEVTVHRPNGQIRNSDTVKPGNDPFPPKG